MTTTQDIPTATAPHSVRTVPHAAIAADDADLTRMPCFESIPDQDVEAHLAECWDCQREVHGAVLAPY